MKNKIILFLLLITSGYAVAQDSIQPKTTSRHRGAVEWKNGSNDCDDPEEYEISGEIRMYYNRCLGKFRKWDGSKWSFLGSDIDNSSSNEYTNPTDTINGRLRKHILTSSFDFSNIPTDYDNAIWEIRYIFDLANADVTLPENVTLQFNGGRITNYNVLTFDNTKIDAGLTQVFDESGFNGILEAEFLYPQWFGAKADNVTDVSSAFTEMFEALDELDQPVNIKIPAGSYYVANDIELFRTAHTEFVEILGYGATLRVDTDNISIFNRIPIDQTEASQMVSDAPPVIKGLTFQGSSTNTNQCGIRIGATYSMRIEDCMFNALDEGVVSSFGLHAKFNNLRFSSCRERAITVQTGASDYDGNPVWSGAALSTSASNVSIFNGIRVHGSSTQKAAFTLLGADACMLLNCISEGSGQLYDVEFNSQGSTTVNNFYVDNFHAESPNVGVNFKVRSKGQLRINKLRRSYPAAIFDISGSVGLETIVDGCRVWANMPDIWFYHTDGEGYGGDETLSTSLSSGCTFQFINGAVDEIFTPEVWEGDNLPANMYMHKNKGQNAGRLENYFGPIEMASDGHPGRDLKLTDFHLYFNPDNEKYIGSYGPNVYRPKGMYIGTDGVIFDSGGSIADVIKGFSVITVADFGTISANSTKTITLDSTYDTEFTGLNQAFVTTLNIDNGDMPSGIILSNVETLTDQIQITLANITDTDLVATKDISFWFYSVK